MSAKKAAAAVKESDVLKAVLRWLEGRGFPHWRMNSGALENKSGRLVRFGAKGMSDIHAIGPGGRAVWIECKRPCGGRLTEAQAAFLDEVNRGGGVGIVVNSVESLEGQMREITGG